MALIYKVLFPSISTFETPPTGVCVYDKAVVHVTLVLLLTLTSRCVLVLMHHNVDPHPGVDAAFPVGHA